MSHCNISYCEKQISASQPQNGCVLEVRQDRRLLMNNKELKWKHMRVSDHFQDAKKHSQHHPHTSSLRASSCTLVL